MDIQTKILLTENIGSYIKNIEEERDLNKKYLNVSNMMKYLSEPLCLIYLLTYPQLKIQVLNKIYDFTNLDTHKHLSYEKLIMINSIQKLYLVGVAFKIFGFQTSNFKTYNLMINNQSYQILCPDKNGKYITQNNFLLTQNITELSELINNLNNSNCVITRCDTTSVIPKIIENNNKTSEAKQDEPTNKPRRSRRLNNKPKVNYEKYFL